MSNATLMCTVQIKIKIKIRQNDRSIDKVIGSTYSHIMKCVSRINLTSEHVAYGEQLFHRDKIKYNLQTKWGKTYPIPSNKFISCLRVYEIFFYPHARQADESDYSNIICKGTISIHHSSRYTTGTSSGPTFQHGYWTAPQEQSSRSSSRSRDRRSKSKNRDNKSTRHRPPR